MLACKKDDPEETITTTPATPEDKAPICSIQYPAEINNSDLYIDGTSKTYTFSATASEENGSITKVRFYNALGSSLSNWTFIEEKTSAPYSINYTVNAGSVYKIRAMAIDDDGDTTISALSQSMSFVVYDNNSSVRKN
jgi:hypothetical protein